MGLCFRILIVLFASFLAIFDATDEEKNGPHFQVDHKSGKLDITATRDSADIKSTEDYVDLVMKPGNNRASVVQENDHPKAGADEQKKRSRNNKKIAWRNGAEIREKKIMRSDSFSGNNGEENKDGSKIHKKKTASNALKSSGQEDRDLRNITTDNFERKHDNENQKIVNFDGKWMNLFQFPKVNSTVETTVKKNHTVTNDTLRDVTDKEKNSMAVIEKEAGELAQMIQDGTSRNDISPTKIKEAALKLEKKVMNLQNDVLDNFVNSHLAAAKEENEKEDSLKKENSLKKEDSLKKESSSKKENSLKKEKSLKKEDSLKKENPKEEKTIEESKKNNKSKEEKVSINGKNERFKGKINKIKELPGIGAVNFQKMNTDERITSKGGEDEVENRETKADQKTEKKEDKKVDKDKKTGETGEKICSNCGAKIPKAGEKDNDGKLIVPKLSKGNDTSQSEFKADKDQNSKQQKVSDVKNKNICSNCGAKIPKAGEKDEDGKLIVPKLSKGNDTSQSEFEGDKDQNSKQQKVSDVKNKNICSNCGAKIPKAGEKDEDGKLIVPKLSNQNESKAVNIEENDKISFNKTKESGTKESEAKDDKTKDYKTNETSFSETKDNEAKDSGTKDSEAKDSRTKENETSFSETKEGETKSSEAMESETEDSKASISETKERETKGSEGKLIENTFSETKNSETKDGETNDGKTKGSEAQKSDASYSETKYATNSVPGVPGEKSNDGKLVVPKLFKGNGTIEPKAFDHQSALTEDKTVTILKTKPSRNESFDLDDDAQEITEEVDDAEYSNESNQTSSENSHEVAGKESSNLNEHTIGNTKDKSNTFQANQAGLEGGNLKVGKEGLNAFDEKRQQQLNIGDKGNETDAENTINTSEGLNNIEQKVQGIAEKSESESGYPDIGENVFKSQPTKLVDSPSENKAELQSGMVNSGHTAEEKQNGIASSKFENQENVNDGGPEDKAENIGRNISVSEKIQGSEIENKALTQRENEIVKEAMTGISTSGKKYQKQRDGMNDKENIVSEKKEQSNTNSVNNSPQYTQIRASKPLQNITSTNNLFTISETKAGSGKGLEHDDTKGHAKASSSSETTEKALQDRGPKVATVKEFDNLLNTFLKNTSTANGKELLKLTWHDLREKYLKHFNASKNQENSKRDASSLKIAHTNGGKSSGDKTDALGTTNNKTSDFAIKDLQRESARKEDYKGIARRLVKKISLLRDLVEDTAKRKFEKLHKMGDFDPYQGFKREKVNSKDAKH